MKRVLLLIALVFFSFNLLLAQRTVSGKVTDDSGEGLPGVNVVIKGTTTGVTTDLDGNYQLAVDEGATLVFSYIGFETQEIQVGSRTTVDIAMGGATELQEVVVTGYGIERAADEVTYQTERVDSDLLMQGQQQSAGQALVGKVAGLQVNVQNNGVNPQTQILLRGLRSISSGNEAMVIIDGAVATIGAFNDLNPNDIQSINVLKGANAGALYGSRAANGAVIVTTKQGSRNGEFTVGINSSMTFEEVAYMPDFQTEHGIGWDGHYDRIENTNWGPRFDGVERPVGPEFPNGYVLEDQVLTYAPIQDNLKDFYETGTTFQNTISFSGGNEEGKFYMSIGNVETKGIVPDDTYERRNFRVNASRNIGKLKLGINSTYFQDKTDVVGQSIGDQDRPLYWFVLNTPANIPLTNYKDWDNPESYAYADNYYNAYYQNPYWAIGTNRDTDKSDRLVANMNIGYDIADNINVTGRIGVNRQTTNGKNWRDAQTYDEDLQPAHSNVSSFLTESESQFTEVNGNIIVSGSFELSSDFSLKPLLGASFIDNSTRSSSIRANNLSIPGFYHISNGTGELVGNQSLTEQRQYGFFADITLGYRAWAFLNLAGRQDYTSTLPLDNNGYFYPAASLSIVLSDAVPTIVDNNILSFVKLTVSNATVYNEPPAYRTNEIFTQPTYFPYGPINGFERSTTTIDPLLAKEKLNTWEFGINIGFLDERFSLDAAYFNSRTTDLITFTTPSIASGASNFLTNIGQLSGSGLELTLSGNVLKAGNFSWNMNVNYTSYETVVDEIKDDLKEVTVESWGGGTYGVYAIVGEAFPQIKAQSYVRDPQGRVVIDPSTGNPIVGEVQAHGKTTPDFIIGATNSFSFKGISLSATLDYRTGHVYYSQGSDAMEFTGRSKESISADRKDFVWPNSSYETTEGNYVANTNIQISGGVMGFWQNTYNDIKENYVKDATALKIREVALNYSLPKKLLSSTGFIKKATVGFIARNLWTRLPAQNRFSDPEFRNTGQDAGGAGNAVGIGGYFQSPPTRSFGFNLNLEF